MSFVPETFGMVDYVMEMTVKTSFKISQNIDCLCTCASPFLFFFCFVLFCFVLFCFFENISLFSCTVL